MDSSFASAILEADEVLVIVNSRADDSVSLAKYYMKKRGIPKENLLEIRVKEKETCSREDYNKKIFAPVKKYLELRETKSEPFIRCLLLMYGMPLKVASTELTKNEKKKQDVLKRQQRTLKKEQEALGGDDPEKKALAEKLKKVSQLLQRNSELSSLDSELALVLASKYELRGWQPNPTYLGHRGRKIADMPDISLMVARLDGPTPEIVRRIIDDSLAAEERGLSGTACFDARWPRPDQKKVKQLKGYGFYDNSLYLAADQVKKDGRLEVVVNDKPELFQPGECPNTALYCGWYRLSHYLDAFDWQPGAIGYHIASGELTTLKKQNSKVWGKRMLEDGAAAVIGPVAEPYVQAFPPPALFFTLLLDGRFTLAECYAFSVPFRSWRMVLVGDPLYRPFPVTRSTPMGRSG
ncbi:MAG: TIGR03790 family protein, partial [Desulfobulbaceae bacterium]|nr:TIGR03790 family protein [Desulfobulbaceae bacterium]